MTIKFMKPANAFCFAKTIPGLGKSQYCVILKKLHNDVNGNCRYEATIVDIDELIWPFDTGALETDRFKFTGHSQTEEYEAEWALDEYLKSEKVLKYLQESE